MQQLLQTMGGTVSTVSTTEGLLAECAQRHLPNIILADYHLDGSETGVNAVLAARMQCGVDIPCIVISADDSESVRNRAKVAGFRFLPKPVNPNRLRALILALSQ